MRIIVAIKQILDPAGITVNRRRERVFTENAERIINPADQRALEAGLRLKEREGGDLIALSLGPQAADDALREALALGADSAYLLSDELLTAADAGGVTRALGKAIEMIGGYDLVLTGQAAADTGSEQIAGRLAELLGLPQVLEAIELEPAGGGLRVTRRWDGARVQVETSLPAVVAVSAEAPPARYLHGGRIMNAYREWGVTTWTTADLGLAEEELRPAIESRGLMFPQPRELGNRLTGSPKEAAREVVTQLRSRRLI